MGVLLLASAGHAGRRWRLPACQPAPLHRRPTHPAPPRPRRRRPDRPHPTNQPRSSRTRPPARCSRCPTPAPCSTSWWPSTTPTTSSRWVGGWPRRVGIACVGARRRRGARKAAGASTPQPFELPTALSLPPLPPAPHPARRWWTPSASSTRCPARCPSSSRWTAPTRWANDAAGWVWGCDGGAPIRPVRGGRALHGGRRCSWLGAAVLVARPARRHRPGSAAHRPSRRPLPRPAAAPRP